jgi:hypothetical protein
MTDFLIPSRAVTITTAGVRGYTGATGPTGTSTATSGAPASATDTGTAGQIRYDSGYIYVCVSANVWKRVAVGTW